jgi:TPR repeat protein
VRVCLLLLLLVCGTTALALDPDSQRFSQTLYLQPYSKLRQAAELGDAESQYDLAYLYYKAGSDPRITGMVQSDKLAAQWYRKAAKQGHSRAQYNMAVLHLQGDGVERDPIEAYAWLLHSSSTGHEPSLVLIAELNAVLNEKQINAAKERVAALGVSSYKP